MKKGIDHALFRRVVVDKEGQVVADKYIMTRPTHGVKEVARRLKAAKAAKKTRKKQYTLAAIERRQRQRRNARA